MADETNQTKKRQSRPKSYNKLLADLEKAKEEIAKAAGNSDLQIDMNALKEAIERVRPELAKAVGVPVHMLKVSAEIMTPVSGASAT